jgi:hypothetical protein
MYSDVLKSVDDQHTDRDGMFERLKDLWERLLHAVEKLRMRV